MGDDGIERDGIKAGDCVVVTGGGGGFGRAFSRRLAKGGAKIAVWEFNADSGRETVRQVEAEGGQARFFQVDLGQRREIEAAVDKTIAAYGVPYCVINNASVYPRASLVDMTAEDWERTLTVNLTAPFLTLKAFGPHMFKRKRGVVINICSGRALQGTPTGANYACTKAALLSLTKTVALEWAKHGIRVNAIVPGVSFTAMPLENTTPEELVERGKKNNPLGRVGYPDDVAGLAAFLVSADAAYMTGQGIAINGGQVMIP